MPLSFKVSGAEKDQLVASMAAILLQDSGLAISAGDFMIIIYAYRLILKVI